MIFNPRFSINEEAIKTADSLDRLLKKKPISFNEFVEFHTIPYVNGRELGYKIIINDWSSATIPEKHRVIYYIAWATNRNSDNIVVYDWSEVADGFPDTTNFKITKESYENRVFFSKPVEAARHIYKILLKYIDHINAIHVVAE